MFVRKKSNKSGSVSVQIIDKSSGKYRVIRTVGSSKDSLEIDYLINKAHQLLLTHGSQSVMIFERDKELQFVDTFVNGLESFSLVGPELLLGKLFDQIGFNTIEEDLFRQLVITRLVYPVSKLKTTDYLFKYKGVEMSVYSIYRYLDKLQASQIESIKNISLQHTLSILGNDLAVVFYDVTTLYFEASDEDDLRKTGFSKDGKHQNPQIVLGLLVSKGGYPLDYDIFEGNKYEGDTLIPVIKHFEKKHKPDKLIIVADAGLLSHKNLTQLKEMQYEYILGARIKNTTTETAQKILQLRLQDKQSTEIKLDGEQRLIISYKKSRALKDAKNRQRGLEKLEKQLLSGKLSKKHINNRGYNKYLKIEGKVNIAIDYEKFKQDSKWDGLKGYLTNTQLSKQEVIEQYGQLWSIERTFRISKSDLQIRPIFHRLRKRIEAHICISFAACKIYKELERQLTEKKVGISAEMALDIVKTIYQINIKTPYSTTIHKRLIIKNKEQKSLVQAFDLNL